MIQLCVLSTGVFNPHVMSHFLFSTIFNKDLQMDRVDIFHLYLSLIEIPAAAL